MILRRIHTTGMKSKVHHTYKTKYRVANWAAYNQALVRRGDMTVGVVARIVTSPHRCQSTGSVGPADAVWTLVGARAVISPLRISQTKDDLTLPSARLDSGREGHLR